jgi:hypothetical protein
METTARFSVGLREMYLYQWYLWWTDISRLLFFPNIKRNNRNINATEMMMMMTTMTMIWNKSLVAQHTNDSITSYILI